MQGVDLCGYDFTDTPTAREMSVRAKPAEGVASAWAKVMTQTREPVAAPPYFEKAVNNLEDVSRGNGVG